MPLVVDEEASTGGADKINDPELIFDEDEEELEEGLEAIITVVLRLEIWLRSGVRVVEYSIEVREAILERGRRCGPKFPPRHVVLCFGSGPRLEAVGWEWGSMLAGDLSDVDEANGGKAADVTFVVFTAAKVALAANTAVNVDDTSSPSMPASRIRGDDVEITVKEDGGSRGGWVRDNGSERLEAVMVYDGSFVFEGISGVAASEAGDAEWNEKEESRSEEEHLVSSSVVLFVFWWCLGWL
ncbi:hypothetical protein MMC14_005106 [Varicellaria rhodocarpa]|nr:hypothetical protein [Varicellaria rhodocarpa]